MHHRSHAAREGDGKGGRTMRKRPRCTPFPGNGTRRRGKEPSEWERRRRPFLWESKKGTRGTHGALLVCLFVFVFERWLLFPLLSSLVLLVCEGSRGWKRRSIGLRFLFYLLLLLLGVTLVMRGSRFDLSLGLVEVVNTRVVRWWWFSVRTLFMIL